MKALRHARLVARALAAYRAGARRGIPGLQFDRFGRRAGLELLLRRERAGADYLVHPVDIVRYFEFEWAFSVLPRAIRRALDVASPRLFSLFLARRSPETQITVINPDVRDVELTRRIASALRVRNLHVQGIPVEDLDPDAEFDSVWSLSVVEHIAAEDGDTAAVGSLYRRLAPGGILVLTVPVARAFRVESREEDVYGTRPPQQDGRFFFQRVYDERSIRRRILAAAPWSDAALAWFGEKTPGWFAAYERRWARDGIQFVVDDPRFIAEHFRAYGSWDEMAGDGVCGIVLRK